MKIYRNLTGTYRAAFLLSALLFLLTAVTSFYLDLKSLTVWSINVWDTLYTYGNPLDFYAYCAQNRHGLVHAMVGSDFLIYLPWAIWNLPLWALQRFHGMNVLEYPGMLLYSKCFLILLTLGCTHVLHKIAKMFSTQPENSSACAFLFLSSFFTLTSVAYIGQNDILVIFVFLWALRFLLTGRWNLFLLFSAISIAFKPYFLFSYIALILLLEKRPHRILFFSLSGVSLYIIQKLPFLLAPMYMESMDYGPTGAIWNLLTENVISLTPFMVSLFALSLLIVYALAYFDRIHVNGRAKIIYYSTLPYICYFLFTRYECYRPLYLFVFMYLLMAVKPAYRRINLWLELLSTACLIYLFLYNGGFFYDGQFLLLPAAGTYGNSLCTLVSQLLPQSYLPVVMAVLLFCLILFAVLNHPGFKSANKVLRLKEEPYLIVLRSCLFAVPYAAAVILKYW